MKLCIIGNPNSVHVLRFASYLYQRGHQVYLVGDHSPSVNIPDEIKFLDLTQINNLRRIRYLIWFMKMRHLIEVIEPDLLHALGCASAGWLGAASGFHPFVITAMGSDVLLLPQKAWLHKQLSIAALRKADHIFCLSNQLQEAVITLGVPPENTSLFYFGFDPDIFHPPADKTAARGLVGFTNEPLIISLRAMNSIYNPLDIAKAIPEVLRYEPQARFMIFQYNESLPILEEFKSIIDRNHATAAVKFISGLTHEADIARYLQAADISISVASSDGTPVSVLESMACGNAVILGDIPSLREWVEHEEQAMFVPLYNPEALADAMIRLIRDQDLRQKLAYNSAKTARSRFSREFHMQQLENIYQRLIFSS